MNSDVVEERIYFGKEADRLLRRSAGWSARHIVELHGHREGRFVLIPGWGIRQYQEQKAAEYARTQMRRVS